MQVMRSSKISSIARDSKGPIRWTGATITASGVGSTLAGYQTQTVIPLSKSLGRTTNPNTNEGMVHLIHAIVTQCRVGVAAAATVSLRTINQIIRRGDARFNDVTFLPIGENPDQVCYESENGVGNGNVGSTFAIYQGESISKDSIYLDKPIIMVEPYFYAVFLVFGQTVSQAFAMEMDMYLGIETVRVKGEEYRRMLDAYTNL